MSGLRVVVTGATGNVGSALVRALLREEAVEEVVGIARRTPDHAPDRVSWRAADVATDALEPLMAGADVVVHLAWLIQPGRDETTTLRVNVEGSRRVFEAAARAGVPRLVHASSVGAYSPGPKDRAVDEGWPTEGVRSSFYARHKAAAERLLDATEREHPQLRAIRLRPGLIFQAAAAQEIRRYFAGPFLPSPLVRRELVRIVPRVPRLRLQAVHADDVAEAYRLVALHPDAAGAYNVAADPVIDPASLAAAFGALQVPVPATLLRLFAAATFHARLQPTEPGWLDMGLGVPIMDTARIRALGWAPRRSATDALLELVDAMGRREGGPTPPLDAGAGGPGRVRELLRSRVGGRDRG